MKIPRENCIQETLFPTRYCFRLANPTPSLGFFAGGVPLAIPCAGLLPALCAHPSCPPVIATPAWDADAVLLAVYPALSGLMSLHLTAIRPLSFR